MKTSDRVNSIQPSPTLAMADKARQLKAEGRDIISLSVGEPDFDTPDFIKEAAIAAIQNGQTKYTAVPGTVALRQAIVDKFKRENQLDYLQNELQVSNGAKQCLYNACQALLNPGDEAIIPTPYWVSYPSMVQLAGAKPVIVTTQAAAHFKLTAEELEAAITPNTRMLFLNSPSNPSGMAYSAAELAALGAVLQKHPNIMVLSDDIYEHIYWGQEPFANIVNACPGLKEQTIIINGVSKAYAMTGWRIGYAAGPTAIIKAMNKIQGQSTSGACSISQAAAAAALNGPTEPVQAMVQAFKTRHDKVLEAINNIDGMSAIPTHGTFYAFPNVEGLMKRLDCESDVDLATLLLEQANVATVPGTAFGVPGYLRLSYATSEEKLKEAFKRTAAL